MDSIQMQIAGLDRKLDRVYETIQQLYVQVSIAMDEKDRPPNSYLVEPRATYDNRSSASLLEPSSSRNLMAHKDILADDDRAGGDRPQGEKELTPEIQIQRLTAQLTAAYNRIAALEEQLLSHHVH